MNTIAELIQKLISSPDVVGLIEYGSARHQDEILRGDYDLVAVLQERSPDVDSLHFHVRATPVDMSIRTLDDIRTMARAEGFESVLLDGRIIHDPSGKLAREIAALRQRHRASPAPSLSPSRIGGLRHGPKHTFEKLRAGRYASTTLGSYMVHQCVYWALPQYFEIRGLRYRGEKHALAYLRQNAPDLHEAFEQFYAAADFERQVHFARVIEETVLAPIGGLWQDGELIVFGHQAKGRAVFRALLGDDYASE